MTFSFSYPKSGLIAVRTKAEISSFPSFTVHEADASTVLHSEPLPESSKAGLLRKLVERFSRSHSLQAFAFSSIVVIGNTLRRLASVLLLRQSQPPHGLALAQALNWCGLPITRRSVFSRAQACKQSARGITQTLRLGVSSVVALGFHEQQSTTGKIPNDGKSTAQSRKSTARDGNNAC